jgi:site-specific DNA-methyltransferase (adenine-specific)
MIDPNAQWQIITGDCLEVMKHIPAGMVDCIVTDPPYGLGERWQGGTWGAAPMYADARKWDILPLEETIQTIIKAADTVILWGGNYFSLPPSRCWLSWEKTSRMNTMADFELAWTNMDRPCKSIREDRNPDGKREHPTQKPVSVMEWCLSFLPAGCTVLDPYCGSGTTGVACIRTGRRFIGIELDPKYADIARRRCAEAEPVLFTKAGKVEEARLFT